MGIFSKLLRVKAAEPTTAQATSPSSIYSTIASRSDKDRFDNIYDNAVALAKGFARVEPFMINDNGKRRAKSNIIDVIYNPLVGVSGYQFRKMLALMTITHDQYYILIHTKAASFITKPTEASITGLEIIQPQNVLQTGDSYSVMTDAGAITVDTSRLIRMTDVLNPFDLTEGYSPMRAVRKWASLDDFIVDYQTGVFASGAVPQGIFNITATKSDFEAIAGKIKATMQLSHGNGVLFNHIPLSSNGVTGGATIEWVPMASTNKEMDTTNLLASNTKKKDSYFGVPQEIRGYLQNSNYASVRVAEFVMTEYSVRDLCYSIWSKLSAELARCTGGFGGSISFELETPIVADEEKVKAETTTINLSNIFNLIDRGYTLEAAVTALNLPDRYLELGAPEAPVDKPEVQDTGEAREGAEALVDNKAFNVKADAPVEINLEMVPVDLTKYQTQFVTIASEQQKRVTDKAIKAIEVKKDAADPAYLIPSQQEYEDSEAEQRDLYEQMLLAGVVAFYVYSRQQQINANKLLVNANQTILNRFTGGDAALTRLVDRYLAGEVEAGVVVGRIELSRSSIIRDYARSIKRVAADYSKETAVKVRSTLEQAASRGMSHQDLTDKLKQLGLEEYRAKRIADSEIHRLESMSQLNIGRMIAKVTGLRAYKGITHDPAERPCPYCEALIGHWEPIDNPIVEKGDTIVGTDGKIMTADYETIDGAHIHPNCHCQLVLRFM